MSYDPQQLDDQARAAQRTNIPGILLVIMGILNGLGAGYFVVNGVFVSSSPEKVVPMMEKMGFGPQQAGQMQAYGLFYIGLGIVGLICSVVTILGGIKMRNLEAHSLAVTAAVMSMLPCLSFPGCCGPGYLVGIWALIVLLDANVKAAFH